MRREAERRYAWCGVQPGGSERSCARAAAGVAGGERRRGARAEPRIYAAFALYPGAGRGRAWQLVDRKYLGHRAVLAAVRRTQPDWGTACRRQPLALALGRCRADAGP